MAAAKLQLTWSDQTHTLSLHSAGSEPVSARRCFPLTDAERFISLVDGRGRERCCIEDQAVLPGDSRRALHAALAATELVPIVQSIESARADATESRWRVVTDRGARDFVVDQEDHIRRLADGRHLITDSHGMRYLVPQLEQLDPASRRLMAQFA